MATSKIAESTLVNWFTSRPPNHNVDQRPHGNIRRGVHLHKSRRKTARLWVRVLTVAQPYKLESFRSCSACLLAFLDSALAFASGASCSMALPRLSAPLPAVFALTAAKPPGILRFFATCAAATHCPKFLIHCRRCGRPDL